MQRRWGDDRRAEQCIVYGGRGAYGRCSDWAGNALVAVMGAAADNVWNGTYSLGGVVGARTDMSAGNERQPAHGRQISGAAACVCVCLCVCVCVCACV
jgi:hypothetical protein